MIDKKWKEQYYNKKEMSHNILFIDTQEEIEQDIRETIEKFLYSNNVKIENIKEKEKVLTEILKILIYKEVSMRKLEKIFNIDKKKIKRLIEKYTC